MNNLNSMHQATEQAATSQVEAREQHQPDKAAVTPAGKELHLTLDDKPVNWQDILWREWRNTEDEEYATHLFQIVGHELVGWRVIACMALLGTLYGQLAGLLLALLTAHQTLSVLGVNVTGSIFVWLGGVLGGIGGLLIRPSWRAWLKWLSPTTYPGKLGNSNIPDGEWWLGLSLGLLKLNPLIGVLLGALTATLSGRKYRSKGRDEPALGFIAGALVGGLGAVVGHLVWQTGWLGLGLGFGLGICSGLVWGSGLVGVVLGWLSIIIGWLFLGMGSWLIGWLSLGLGYGIGATITALIGQSNVVEQYLYRSWYFWWRGRPSIVKVRTALAQAITTWPQLKVTWAKLLTCLEQQREYSKEHNQFIKALYSPHWVDRFAARHALVALGGEVTESLRSIAADNSNPIQPTAIQLLTQIEQETTARLAWRSRELLCPHCLARFGRRTLNLSWGVSFNYYGCRLCGQSREFLAWLTVVAALDANWSDLYQQQGDLLRINWLTRRNLFDFDRIEIIQASDEEVERFAVQVGNDTDPFRQPRYKQMPCIISPECRLSENTLRILRRTFGLIQEVSLEPNTH